MLSKTELNKIKEHRYVSGHYTLLDEVMNKFIWEPFLVKFVPMWIAPNLITTIGTVIVLVTTGIALFHCPTLTEAPPVLLCLMLALGDFIYQLLDAIDGKQARRTGSSSPLGQLFDHGCDCIICIAFILQLLLATQSGYGYTGLIVATLSSTGFFIGNHEERFTGVLRTAVGHIGVTEMQFTQILVLLVTAFSGPKFWNSLVPGFEVTTFRTLLLMSLISFTLIASAGSFARLIFRGVFLDAVLDWPPVLLSIASAYALRDGPVILTCLAVNLPITLATGNMILTSVSGKYFPTIYYSQFPLIAVAGANYLDLIPQANLTGAVAVVACITGLELMTFCFRASWAISAHLGIKIFKLKNRK